MGTVYNNCPCVCSDFSFQFLQIRLKGFCIRRDFHKLSVIIFYICTIFQKIWCKNNYFLTGIQNCFQNHVQSACSSHCHDQVFRRKICPKTAVQGLRNGFTHILKSCVIHIPVKNYRILIICQINNGFPNTVRRGNAGISQAEIIYFICSVLFFQTIPLLKHSTDRRIILNKRNHFFCYHIRQLLSFLLLLWPKAIHTTRASIATPMIIHGTRYSIPFGLNMS